MKRFAICIVSLVILIAIDVNAQQKSGYRYVEPFERRALFVNLGYSWGPHFNKFVDWANNHYATNANSADRMDDFGGGIDFSLGLRNRFSKYFAVEFDFAVHSVTTRKNFYDQSSNALIGVQDLDLNTAKFTVSLPILLDFSDRQPVVPFVAAGITIFSMRLDHSIQYNVRYTKVALAANISVGLERKIRGRLWADIRGDWTMGTTKMPVSQYVGEPDQFTLSLNTAQLHLGVLYSID